MDGAPAADRWFDPLLVHRLSGPAQSQLLVDVRRHPVIPAGRADRHRRHSGDALHAARRHGVQFRRAYHARRELRLAAALPALERRIDVLCRGLHPHVPRHVLRLVQGATRGALDPRRHSLSSDDGDRVPRLHAAVGPDELLGRHRHHQLLLGDTDRRRNGRHLALGRLRGRQPDAAALLLAALSAAVRDRRRRGAAHLGAALRRAEQSDRHRAEDRQGHRRVHALRHHQGRILHGVLLRRVRLVRVLHAELSRSLRQLHPGQPGGDAERTSFRSGTICRSTRSFVPFRTSCSA